MFFSYKSSLFLPFSTCQLPTLLEFLVQGQVLTQHWLLSWASFCCSRGVALWGTNRAPVNFPVLLGAIALLTDYELFLRERNELWGCKWSNLSYSAMWTLSNNDIPVLISKFHYRIEAIKGFCCHRMEIYDVYVLQPSLPYMTGLEPTGMCSCYICRRNWFLIKNMLLSNWKHSVAQSSKSWWRFSTLRNLKI